MRRGSPIVVNGARAREPRVEGEPVVFALRDVLERAHDVDEAVALLKTQPVMVSHLVLVADAKGRSAIVERAPDVPATVRTPSDPDRVPSRTTSRGRSRAIRRTSPCSRRRRPRRAGRGSTSSSRQSARTRRTCRARSRSFAITTARRGSRARSATAGRSTRSIATHGIVADTTDRVLWVSAGPHLSGAFVRFDLKAIFAPGHDPANDPRAGGRRRPTRSSATGATPRGARTPAGLAWGGRAMNERKVLAPDGAPGYARASARSRSRAARRPIRSTTRIARIAAARDVAEDARRPVHAGADDQPARDERRSTGTMYLQRPDSPPLGARAPRRHRLLDHAGGARVPIEDGARAASRASQAKLASSLDDLKHAPRRRPRAAADALRLHAAPLREGRRAPTSRPRRAIRRCRSSGSSSGSPRTG